MKRELPANIENFAFDVIGAALEVHKILGPGYLESVYEEALSTEFDLRRIPYLRQHPIGVIYKNKVVGESRLDFLIGSCLIVELKAVDRLAPIHHAQVLSYLRITKLQLGLLLNFNVVLLKSGIERVILSA